MPGPDHPTVTGSGHDGDTFLPAGGDLVDGRQRMHPFTAFTLAVAALTLTVGTATMVVAASRSTGRQDVRVTSFDRGGMRCVQAATDQSVSVSCQFPPVESRVNGLLDDLAGSQP